MSNFGSDKKMAKRLNREATIKHYILGFLLECIIKDDINVIRPIRVLLVYNLKILDEDTFISCLRKARYNRMLKVRGTKRNYKEFKKNITLIPCEDEEQIRIINALQEFAKNYENGFYINSNMMQSDFVKIQFKGIS